MTTFCEQTYQGGKSLEIITRLAENGYGEEVFNLALNLCRESYSEVQTWDAIKDLPRGSQGRTLLMYAAKTGDLHRLRWLLKRNANVNIKTKSGMYAYGYTALHYACENGHIDIVEELLKHKVDINSKLNIKIYFNIIGETTPLAIAIKFDHFNIVKLLLENGAYDESALLIASMNNNIKIVNLLLDFNYEINKLITTTQSYYKKWTPLMFACENNNLELVTLLLEKGADPRVHPPYMTPFRCAIKSIDIIKLFIQYKICM